MEITPENPPPPISASLLRWGALIALTALVTILFLEVALPFLISLIMAAIAAPLSDPLYQFLLRKTGNRAPLAAMVTLLVMLIAIIAPLIGIGYLAASQASGLTGSAVEIYRQISTDVDGVRLPDWVPFRDKVIEAWPQISAKIQELVGTIASFLGAALSAFTKGTASFFLNFFVYLYALFFFLQTKRPIIQTVLSYTGLPPVLQETLAQRMVSVSRATIKGTLLIGVVQGAMGGLGFWLTGIEGPAFWAVVMAIASVIPGIGATFVVFGGAIYLGIEGEMAKAIGLGLWAALAVGTIDNVLRPVLVGRDAEMHDIFILIGTLGGLSVYGAVGLVIGPVLAGLFLTVWTTMRELSAYPEEDAAEDEAEPPADDAPENPEGATRNHAVQLTVSSEEMEAELETLKQELAELKALPPKDTKGGA